MTNSEKFIREVFKKIEENPKSFIVFETLLMAEEAIQRDLGKICLKDVEFVLKKFALSCIEHYEFLLKLVLFPSHDRSARDVLFKGLIEQRMINLLKSVVVERGYEDIDDGERDLSATVNNAAKVKNAAENPSPNRLEENPMFS